MKKIASVLFHRLVLVAADIALQILLLAVAANFFSEYYWPFHWAMVAISLAAVLWIVNSRSCSGFKIAWIILILLFPVFGGLLYLILGGGRITPRARRRLGVMERTLETALKPDFQAENMALEAGVTAGNMARYLEDYAHCPVYRDTAVTYYPLGDDCFQPILEDIRKAEKYVFLEYFIIEEGEFWNAILEILKRKVIEGVDVRVIYDDIGSIHTVPSHYARDLEEMGLKCIAFNRFMPILSVAMNNRDHRKILSVDGKIAYTGGVNLADEYINRRERFGHWKDTAVRLEGPAAWSMTVMFMTMWNFAAKTEEALEPFRPVDVPIHPQTGWVQPYTDCPWDSEQVGQTVYLNLISAARRYVYICTPYLILDEAMKTALAAAAKSGVDVRLMTPHIPDKKMIFQITRAHYEPLVEDGVKIYEYTPGFIHAKSFVVDDRFAVVGSVNLDYRSLFLHFENGALLIDNPAVADVKRDYLETVEKCVAYTMAECRKVGKLRRFFRSLLRLFAPLF